jgi:hypothetical protein
VKNIFDIMSAPIEAADSDSVGATAYSDLTGDPLPGRQWLFFLEKNF